MPISSFEIIPAIDVIEGKCVRLSQGDYSKKTIYNERPLEVALQFEDAGIQRLHLVDLDGAKVGKVVNWKVLEQIAAKTKLVIDFGGGVKGFDDVDILLSSGAGLATVGSMAVKNESLFLAMVEHYGSEKFFVGADVSQERIAVGGWLEQTDIYVYDFINKFTSFGLRNFFCTDIAKDGMMQGPAIDLYKTIIKECAGVRLTASGGVNTLDDVHQLRSIGCAGVIIGKAIYEGKILLTDLAEFAQH